MSGINVPINGNDSQKLDVALLPSGWQLATVYGIAVVGHHETKFGDKLQAFMGIEFPLHYAQFYEDQEPKPYGKWDRIYNFTFYKNSGFRKHIEGMLGKKLSDEQAAAFDITSLIGQNFVAKITHTDDGKYFNIDSLTPLDDQMRTLFHLEPGQNKPQINDTIIYSIGSEDDDYNFLSQDFINLPNWLKDTVKESNEAKKWVAKGNSFPKDDEQGSSNKIVMIANDFSYAEYIKAGYTDELLVSEGKAKWAAPTVPNKPVGPSAPNIPSTPSAPSVPKQPVAPAPSAPKIPSPNASAPVVPSPPKPVRTYFKFEDPSNQPYYDKFIAEGWTDESLEESNFGKIVTE